MLQHLNILDQRSVISEYDSDDLYNGSLDNEYSDEDDEFYYGSSMEEDSSIVTSDNDIDS